MIWRHFSRLLLHTKASRRLLDASGQPQIIEITESAVQKLKELGQKKGPDSVLRVAIDSGGCHGFQYRFELDREVGEDDVIFERDGTKVIVDEVSLGYLSGSQLDYSTELIGSTFHIIENPRATSGCGCGVSFSLKPPPNPNTTS